MRCDDIIYLDNNASTRPLASVVDAMLPYWTDYYMNPDTPGGIDCECSVPIAAVKSELAALIKAREANVVLTSGATEANNWVFSAIASQTRNRRCRTTHYVVSAIEHPSVLMAAKVLAERREDCEITIVPVDSHGVVAAETVLGAVRPDTQLVSVMLANNESGVIQPVGAIAEGVKRIASGCVVHTDATQALGRIAIDCDGELDAVDCLSVSAHKCHGPKGIGALVLRKGVSLPPMLVGGEQESGMRAGTRNPPLAAGFLAAIRASADGIEMMQRVGQLRDMLERELLKRDSGVQILGRRASRLPNTSFVAFPEFDASLVVATLFRWGIVCSTGSACSSGSDKPSGVAVAMGLDHRLLHNTVRFSLSRFTTECEVERCIEACDEIARCT